MKITTIPSSDGFKRAVSIPEESPQSHAKYGIPVGVDLSELDIPSIIREVNDILINKKIFTMNDIRKHQNSVTKIVTSVVKRHIMRKFKEQQ